MPNANMGWPGTGQCEPELHRSEMYFTASGVAKLAIASQELADEAGNRGFWATMAGYATGLAGFVAGPTTAVAWGAAGVGSGILGHISSVQQGDYQGITNVMGKADASCKARNDTIKEAAGKGVDSSQLPSQCMGVRVTGQYYTDSTTLFNVSIDILGEQGQVLNTIPVPSATLNSKAFHNVTQRARAL